MIDIIKTALEEDIGTGDVSVSLLNNTRVHGKIIAKESATVCGVDYVNCSFALLDKDIHIDWQVQDGDPVAKDQVLCQIQGNSQSILSGERVALNFLQTLSGVATQTKVLVDKIAHTKAKLLDTRKTIPGLRVAQKYAVTCGGGINHRMGLYDCVMLKENHTMVLGSIKNAVRSANAGYPNLPLIVEVENISQLSETLNLTGVDRVLCDNFSIDDLRQAVVLAKGKIPIEASGNIDKSNIIEVAQTGVDYISIGAITKNIQAVDLSLRFS